MVWYEEYQAESSLWVSLIRSSQAYFAAIRFAFG